MPVSKKRKKEKTKQPLYSRCRACGKDKSLSVKRYCPQCMEIKAKLKAYGEYLMAKGLLPSLDKEIRFKG